MNAMFLGTHTMENPKMINSLFSKTTFSWLWLVIRIFVGVQWLTASLFKLSSPSWMRSGNALQSIWTNAVAIPAPPARPLIYYDWYRSFIQSLLNHHSYLWLSKFISIGEFLVGIALILGFLVGVSSFLGGIMHLGLLLTGSIGAAPILIVMEMLLIVAWKTAGYYGLDRYFFNFIGAPWKPGRWFQKKMA